MIKHSLGALQPNADVVAGCNSRVWRLSWDYEPFYLLCSGRGIAVLLNLLWSVKRVSLDNALRHSLYPLMTASAMLLDRSVEVIHHIELLCCTGKEWGCIQNLPVSTFWHFQYAILSTDQYTPIVSLHLDMRLLHHKWPSQCIFRSSCSCAEAYSRPENSDLAQWSQATGSAVFSSAFENTQRCRMVDFLQCVALYRALSCEILSCS